MKKLALFPVALLAASLHTYAQPTFMKMFQGGGTSQFDLFELNSGNLFTGMAYSSGTSLMDPEGTIIHTACYEVDTFLVLQTILKRTDNEFYFGGAYYRDTCTDPIFGLTTNLHPALGRMDSLGNVLDIQHYILNTIRCTTGVLGHLGQTSNGDVLAWGRDASLFAMRTDPTGAVVWAKSSETLGGFQFIKELPGGDLLAGMNVYPHGSLVARLQANGEFIWCKSYFRPSGMIHDAVIQSDDSFIITGLTDSTDVNVSEPFPKLFMMQLNGAGEVQWCKGYEAAPNPWYTPQTSKLARTAQGDYVILATLGYEHTNFQYRPFWMKVDQNGDTLWTRSLQGDDRHIFYTKSLLLTADGGIVFNGMAWRLGIGGSGGGAFIYKADADGHLPCEEAHAPMTVMDLFPTDSSMTLVFSDGAERRPAFVAPRSWPPIIQYDGCIETPVPEFSEEWKPRLRPNPTTGRITLEFADPLLAETYYSVYDSMGKLLLQRPLPTGATVQEVDLARFGAGSYVIKFTSSGTVCYERVVVE